MDFVISTARKMPEHSCEVSLNGGPASQFQIRTVPSEPPETKCSALWSKMTLWTSSSWPNRLESCPDFSSKVFTVPSLLARATMWPGMCRKEIGGLVVHIGQDQICTTSLATASMPWAADPHIQFIHFLHTIADKHVILSKSKLNQYFKNRFQND